MNLRCYALFFGLALAILWISGCESDATEASVGESPPLPVVELVAIRCGSCHLPPAPEELDKQTWAKGVLPEMAARFGHYHYKSRSEYIEQGTAGQIVAAAGVFPTEPTISREDFERIERYYIDNAPDSLPAVDEADWPPTTRFQAEPIKERYNPPMGTLLKSFPERDRIIYADAKEDYSNIEILDTDFRLIQRLAVPHPISDVTFLGDTLLATSMGQFTPTDAPSGSISKIFQTKSDGEYAGFFNEVTGLQRPLHTEIADLNQDDRPDLIVSEYGNHTGNLVWYENLGHRSYDRHVLSAQPGALKTVIKDFDGNGLPDILALMAQGDEGVDLYLNFGNGAFERKRVLRFPSLYGSANIHLADVNGDGHEDLLYVNGDNADYSMVPKPYHGLRIFTNDGANNFTEAYFFPLPGAYDAQFADFDGDGDLDMVAIAFFPAEGASGRGVVYLENVASEDGNFSYEAQAIPGTDVGRWIQMEVNDLDADGLPDVTLLAFTGLPLGNVSDEQYRKWLDSPSILHLRNTKK
ncbi:MAG: VCBS repeat-containing protein [Lewinella sp.]